MFIKDNVFKRLVKKAYNDDELRIERSGEVIAIKSTWWHLQCVESYLSNKAKACLIELIGDLPEDSQAMTYGKRCEPQIALPRTVIKTEMPALRDLLTESYEPTRVMLQGSENVYTILQSAETKEKTLVNSVFIDALDIDGIDREEGETQVNAFPLGTSNGATLIYSTNVMDFIFYTTPVRYRKTKAIMDLLSEQDCAWNLTEDERLD